MKIRLCIIALKTAYLKAVSSRLGKTWYRTFDKEENVRLLTHVAEEIRDPRLAGMFVDAQFLNMPSDFCERCFKTKYPPFSVVFGEGCIKRYKCYVDNGFTIPSVY